MSKYTVALNMTEVASRVFNGLEIPSSTITSFATFRKIAQTTHKACMESRKQMEAERAEMLKIYSQSVVSGKLEELNNRYNQKISAVKSKLSEKLNAIITAKENAISNYTVTPATDEQMRLLQTVQMRENEISDTEWQMIVRKCADNYQALSIVRLIAEKNDRPFSMPFDPESDLRNLTLLKAKCETVIENIDRDASDNGVTAEFLNYGQEQDSLTTRLIDEMDKTVSSATPTPLKDQLRDASRNALRAGDYDTFHKITSFIVDYSDKLSVAVPSADIRESAQILIDAGNSAKEVKKSYESHRDEVLKKYDM